MLLRNLWRATLIVILQILFTATAFQCYKKCSCLKNKLTHRSGPCKTNTKYLNINITDQGLGIHCGYLNSKQDNVEDSLTFDAKSLIFINDSSPLTLKYMTQRCQKAKSRKIFYDLNIKQLKSINITKDFMTKGLNPIYLDINVNLASRNDTNVVNIESNFLKYATNLKTLTLRYNNMAQLNNIFKETSIMETLTLSSNDLHKLPEKLFEKLSELKSLNLQDNKITYLNKKIMNGIRNITFLDLSNNNINNIEKNTFEDFLNLTYLNLSSNRLTSISEGIFVNNKNVKTLDLSKNTDLILPKNILKSLNLLKILNLSQCNLKSIPQDLCVHSISLEDLNLSNNQLKEVSASVFNNLNNLLNLDLSFNELETLPKTLLAKLNKIKKINLSNNKLTNVDIGLLLSNQDVEIIDLSNNLVENITNDNESMKIKHLILRNNSINIFPTYLIYNSTIKFMDLSFNGIQKFELMRYMVPTKTDMQIDLSSNIITEVIIEGSNKSETTWRLFLNTTNNYVDCNCDLFTTSPGNLTLHMTEFQIKHNETYCIDKAQNKKCPMIKMKNCPISCDCYFRNSDRASVVDCSFKKLSVYPVIMNVETDDDIYKNNQTIVFLQGNDLNLEKQENIAQYSNVTELDLSFNKISDIQWIPSNIRDLNLEGNHLESLNEDIVEALNKPTFKKVILGKNSWVCNTKSIYLQRFLIQYNNKKVNESEVMCKDTGESLAYSKILDQHQNVMKMAFLVGITVILAFASILLTIYYRYGKSIKIYLYSKNMCLWCVAEEELDREKQYDIFISYSHKDEHFIQNHLLKELEGFNICIHYKDWLPGEFISKQIVNSVLNSRRTLVVLSNNFLESVWGKMEFRTAHTQAITEGRARVIVVIYGDLNEEGLDNEMGTYLKTNTYVKWGDPWFWNKLKYALPHSRGNVRSSKTWNVEKFTVIDK